MPLIVHQRSLCLLIPPVFSCSFPPQSVPTMPVLSCSSVFDDLDDLFNSERSDFNDFQITWEPPVMNDTVIRWVHSWIEQFNHEMEMWYATLADIEESPELNAFHIVFSPDNWDNDYESPDHPEYPDETIEY
jgi:hypothetical protein